LEIEQKRFLIEANGCALSVREQCELIGLNRSSYYYEVVEVSAHQLKLLNRIDELFTQRPFLGSRKLSFLLNEEGFLVGRDKVRSAMKQLGLVAVYPKPRLSGSHPEHRIYPYLLRGLAIERPNQVWSTDITYIRMRGGFMYLTAVIDWYSRFVLSWRLSNSLSEDFCVEALEAALHGYGKPEIFNTDQGSQFTGHAFTGVLIQAGVQISMDGRGRALDNVFVERLWRTVKYEDIYLKRYELVPELQQGLGQYFGYYNYERPHQSLAYQRPWQVYKPG
jgi:putative transposase